MKDVEILIDYDFIGDEFWIGGNARFDRVKDLLLDYLRTKMGTGPDDRESNTLNLYQIDISIDLSYDIFKCHHNCGNKGLREGILLRLINRLT